MIDLLGVKVDNMLMIVVNFKTYKEATGNNAINLARICRDVQEKTGVPILVVPQLVDLRNCIEAGVECWTQHVDDVEQGKFTGWVNIESVEEVGATGTLLNHSEHKVDISNFKFEVFNRYPNFRTCVCVNDQEEAKLILEKCKPDYLAYEPAEYIGSTTKTVATERPEIISEMVTIAGQVPVLVGAGVHTVEDIKIALKLGAKGVLLATGVVLVEDPEAALMALAEGFK